MAGTDDREAESKQILDRIARESDAGSSLAGRGAQRVRNHISATDAAQDDWIEQWGTRIGRVLGLSIMLGLLVWLAVYLFRG